eukprot:scaffold110495_cov40-Phaeocystis_antarctica.AAC.2
MMSAPAGLERKTAGVNVSNAMSPRRLRLIASSAAHDFPHMAWQLLPLGSNSASCAQPRLTRAAIVRLEQRGARLGPICTVPPPSVWSSPHTVEYIRCSSKGRQSPASDPCEDSSKPLSAA